MLHTLTQFLNIISSLVMQTASHLAHATSHSCSTLLLHCSNQMRYPFGLRVDQQALKRFQIAVVR